MHGFIFTELQRFVDRNLEPGAWSKALRVSNLGDRAYVSLSDYPDAELFSLVSAASDIAHKSQADVIEAFGTFIAPDLLSMYSILIKPEWKTLDVIEHTEAVIHSVVRVSQVGAKPPELKCKRVAPNEIELRYDSERRLCRLARGIIQGIAHKYQDVIEVIEYECMHRGAPACVMHIRDVGAISA